MKQTPLPDYVRLLLTELQPSRLTTIVDVGANPVNTPTYDALLAAKGCCVVGFEPQPSAFAELKDRQTQHETYLPYAVGDGTPQTLHVMMFGGLTSILPPYAPSMLLLGQFRWRRIVERLPMDTVQLDAMPDLPSFDMLKIDIQGGEAMVLSSGTKALSNAVCVIIELRYLRLYENEPMMGGIDCELRNQGFELHKFQFNKSMMITNSQGSRLKYRENRDQLVDGDAVYLRDLTKMSTFSDDQIKHLAILAASTFTSHSLVVHCLDELVRRKQVDETLPRRYVDELPDVLKN